MSYFLNEQSLASFQNFILFFTLFALSCHRDLISPFTYFSDI